MIWNYLQLFQVVLLSVGVLGIVLFFFIFVWKGRSPFRGMMLNVSLLIGSLWLVFLAFEIVFFVAPQSDGWLFTKSGNRWGFKYWGEPNSLGFRDREHTKEQLEREKLIFVVGDSFVAGWGVENREDRFADLLQKRLPDGWRVVVVADLDWDTRSQYLALSKLSVEPDIVLLAYNLNDIFKAAVKAGIQSPKVKPIPHPLVQPFVDSTYLFNFLYWRLYRFANTLPDLFEFYESAFGSSQVWEAHKRDLHQIIAYSEESRSSLFVVIFPLLQRVDDSHQYTSMLRAFFAEEQVPVLDLSNALGQEDPQMLIVNSFDAHPSEKTHRIVAQRIEQRIIEMIGRR